MSALLLQTLAAIQPYGVLAAYGSIAIFALATAGFALVPVVER